MIHPPNGWSPMLEVICPDGTIAAFPDTMSDDEIAAVLQREFPEPRPATLTSGEVARRSNGASVSSNAIMGRYIIHNAAGAPAGFRQTLDEALDLADALPPPRAPRTVKPEPVTVAMPPEVGNALLASEIDSHIRQTEGKVRRAQRESINQRRRRR